MSAVLAAAPAAYDPRLLTFNEERHEYRYAGVVVPSVTSFLDRLHSFAGVPFDVLEAAKVRGTYAHRMCELLDQDELDEPLVPDEYRGYLQAWKQFMYDYAPNWAGIESRSYSVRHGFAGTEDRHGTFERLLPGRWGIDIKTSVQSHPVWGLQLAAYRQIRAERDMRAALDRRGTVQLRKDGTYLFTEFNNPADWPTFQALITLVSRTATWPK